MALNVNFQKLHMSNINGLLLFGLFVLLVHGEKEQYPVDADNLEVVILSQHNAHHVHRAMDAAQHLDLQIEDFRLGSPKIHLLHESWTHVGAWTVLPIIPDLAESDEKIKWVLIMEEETRVKLKSLLQLLQTYDSQKAWFLGRGLHDQEATIIHHFAFYDNPASFAFPDFAAGVLMSRALINSLAEKIKMDKPASDFSIDPKYELALYIWDKGEGVALTEVSTLCAGNEGPLCITSYPEIFPDCGPPIGKGELFIAVKTAEKFHKDRIPVIKHTWEGEAEHIQYFSETEDADIPTVDIGVPNTEQGHCAKLMAILERAHDDPELAKFEWIVVTDDDTLLSVKRLRRLLACYAPDDAVALGERYGFGVTAGYGYDYITGGGGMVLNRQAIQQVVGSQICQCAKPDAPDDMTLGSCLYRLGIPITHSPLFHQARPADYSLGYLGHQKPVSFHKHWMVDPIKVYEYWLQEASAEEDLHDEL